MDFGRKMLEKYGYTEGTGLGKNNNGITEAIKANFKFDNKGFGEASKSSEDHWWERCFNEAASNVNVKKEDGKIAIDLEDKEGVEITNKSYSLKKLKQMNGSLQYGNFLKSATLLANVGKEQEIANHISTHDIQIKPIQVLNDDELFKACEGRTAHKGARHGLKLSGKLQRIAEQEKLLLERMKQNKSDVFKTPVELQAQKKPLIELNSSKEDISEDELPLNLQNEEKSYRSKKKVMRDKKKFNSLASKLESIGLEKTLSCESIKAEDVHTSTPLRKKRKPHKKIDKFESIVEHEESPQKDEKKKAKASKKRKSSSLNLDDDEPMVGEKKTKSAKNEENSKSKRVKLNESHETSSDEEEDAVDKINIKHHQVILKKASANLQVNPDSSSKKNKRRKNKHSSEELWDVKIKKKSKKNKKLSKQKIMQIHKHEAKLSRKERREKKVKRKLEEAEAAKLASTIDGI